MDPKNKRRKFDDKESEKQSLRQQRIQKARMICERCNSGMLLDSWFTTHGPSCSHVLCARCLGKQHARRGCGIFWCEVCQMEGQTEPRRTTYTIFNEINYLGLVIADPEEIITPPHPENDPIQYHIFESDELTRRNTMLTMVLYPQDGQYRGFSMRLPTKNIQESTIPQQEKIKLKSLFILLHPYLMSKPPKNPHQCFSHPNDRPRLSTLTHPLELFSSAKDDNSLLFECILRLVTGLSTLKTDVKSRNGYWSSQLMAIWTGVEMIRRAMTKKPGLLQQVLAQQLRLHQVPKTLMDFLSKSRLAASINFVDSHRFRDIDNKILEGWDFKNTAYGLFVVLYDNFGFRIRGASAGYYQSTMIQVKYVTPDDLQTKVQAYGPGKRSRKALKWNDEKEKDEVTADIFLPNNETDDLLSARSLEWIELALKYADRLPTVEEAEVVLKDYEKSAKATVPLSVIPSMIVLHNDNVDNNNMDDQLFDEQLTTDGVVEAPLDHLEHGNNGLTAAAVVDTPVDVDEVDPHQDDIKLNRPTMYEINGVKLDVPWSKDLACSTTTDNIRDYTLHLRKRSQESIADGSTQPPFDNDNDDDDEDDNSSTSSYGEPVMKSIGVFSVGDGQPAHQLIASRDKNPDAHKHYRNVNGCFHELLEEFKKAGERKDEIFAGDLYSWWRKSRKAIEYVLYPSDPGQALPELIESTFALLTSAARATTIKLKLAGRTTINPVDVLDHIIERARVEPICMAVLSDMRLTDIIFMTRDSENANGKGDPKLYRTALRYTAILYSVTNAYKYVRILSENFKDWYCASDLERAINDEFLFTQKTRNGRPIWTDRSVEWMMKDLRSWLGKHYVPGQELLLSRLALNLSDMVKARTAKTTDFGNTAGTNSCSAPKELGATRVFLSTILWADKINLWGPDSIVYSKTGEKSNGYNGRAFDSTGKNELNLQHLLGFSIGKENFRNYVQEYLFDNLGQVTRPSNQAPLKKIPAYKESVDQQRDIDASFFTSQNFEELNAYGVYRKDDLIEQAKKENALLLVQDQIKLPSRSKRKQDHINALLDIRKISEEKGIDLAPARANRQNQSSTSVNLSWEDQVKEETKLPYFYLTDTQREKYKTEEHEYTLKRGVMVDGSDSNGILMSQNSGPSIGLATLAGVTFVSDGISN